MGDSYLDDEEAFHPKGKRGNRKERQQIRAKDRSKYKQSDRDQKAHHLEKRGEPLKKGHMRARVLSLSAEGALVSDGNKPYVCTLKGSLKKEKTKYKNLVTVGDWVQFEKKSEESGVIVHVEKRRSFLIRSEHLSRRKYQLIAANIDQVFIVTSVVQPKFKPLLIDRYLLSAKRGNMKPIILINKIDLLQTPSERASAEKIALEQQELQTFLEAYSSLSIPIVLLSASTGENIDQLKNLMHHQTSVFSGQSGVGKSSLINAVLGSHLPTGEITKKTQKGSHTTTVAQLIPIEQDGLCIDTPGIRSFGIWDNTPAHILDIFPDFFPFSSSCKFPNCTHIHEPDCGVKQGLQEEKIHPLRYASYRALLEESPPKEWE